MHIDPKRCPVDQAIELLGGKWKPLILWRLNPGTLRFGQLQKALPDVTQRTLTLQLRELESEGLVERTVYPEVPPKVEYALTSLGRPVDGAERTGAFEPAAVEGPICESTDSLGAHDLPPLRRGDLVAIADAGAYAASQSSAYNGRPRPPQELQVVAEEGAEIEIGEYIRPIRPLRPHGRGDDRGSARCFPLAFVLRGFHDLG